MFLSSFVNRRFSISANKFGICLEKRQYHLLKRKNDIKIQNGLLDRTISTNTHWRIIENFLRKLGVLFQEGRGSRTRISLDGHTMVFHVPHETTGMDRGRLNTLGTFLEKVGVKPIRSSNE